MTAQDWIAGRRSMNLTQVEAASSLGVSQPYLSQLEKGLRVGATALAKKAADLYKLPTALPLPNPEDAASLESDTLQKALAALGYPKFAHVRSTRLRNPAGVVFAAVVQRDLDTRLVEALPWVLTRYVDLNWPWLRDRVKLRNVQNRLGYLVHLAKEVARSRSGKDHQLQVLSAWERDLEAARLVREDTLCRESMSQPERTWLKTHRPAAARHWNLLTSLTQEQLPYGGS